MLKLILHSVLFIAGLLVALQGVDGFFGRMAIYKAVGSVILGLLVMAWNQPKWVERLLS